MIWIGLAGQALFAARVLLQWIASERAGRILIPRGYWEISLLGSALVLTYAVGVSNLVFVLSAMPGAAIAARNLKISRPTSRARLVAPGLILLGLLIWSTLAQPRVGPPLWAAVGLLGALLWAFRFVVQWWVSERAGESQLPRSFWIFSLAGSLLLLSYAFSRLDPVMIAGYAFGCLPYARNLRLARRGTSDSHENTIDSPPDRDVRLFPAGTRHVQS